MQVSGLGREARRRPELDLLVGPLEAASRRADTSADADGPHLELIELPESAVLPTRNEDG